MSAVGVLLDSRVVENKGESQMKKLEKIVSGGTAYEIRIRSRLLLLGDANEIVSAFCSGEWTPKTKWEQLALHYTAEVAMCRVRRSRNQEPRKGERLLYAGNSSVPAEFVSMMRGAL